MIEHNKQDVTKRINEFHSNMEWNKLKEIPTEIGLIAGLLTLGGTRTSLVKKERERERL